MSLFITAHDIGVPSIERRVEIEWHTGESFPIANVESIDSIQADGDELDLIIRSFTTTHFTIPVSTNSRVQSWYGDIAKTICFYLKSYRSKA